MAESTNTANCNCCHKHNDFEHHGVLSTRVDADALAYQLSIDPRTKDLYTFKAEDIKPEKETNS